MTNSLKHIRKGLAIASRLPAAERLWIGRELATDARLAGTAFDVLPVVRKSSSSINRHRARRRPSAFLSYNHRDRLFVRKLALHLKGSGIDVWHDERDLNIGESIATKVSDAIHAYDFVVAILSSNSVGSSWVQHELQLAVTQQIETRVTKVLPVLKNRCEVPTFLRDKLAADLSSEKKVTENLGRLVESIHRLFNERDA